MGQGETAPGGMLDSEGPLRGGRQQGLVQVPSKEGPVLIPRIAHVEGGESTEGSNNGRTKTGRRPAAWKPPGKAAKRPSPQAEPGTSSEEEIGQKGPSGSGEKKAAPSKPARPPKKRLCHTCGRVCPRLMARNKQLKKDYLGTPVSRRWGPKRYKRRSNRKRQKTESGSSGHSTAGVERQTHAPAPKPKVSQFEPRNPGPGGGEDSGEDSSISGRDKEDFASGSTKDTDREARKSHEPQSPSPTEFVMAISQEHGERGQEEAAPREEPDSPEARRGSTGTLLSQKQRNEAASHICERQGTKNSLRSGPAPT